MKLFNALASLPLLALCSQTLQTHLFERLPLQISSGLQVSTTSKLPLFIDDRHHPWIEENIAWLEQRSDPTNDLCAAGSALRNEGIGGRAVPADLFDRLEIDNNRYGIEPEGWVNLRDRLKEISKCPVALQQVTYLYIDVYVDEDVPMDPDEKTIQLLANVLSAMPNLKGLEWGIPARANKFIGEVFARRSLQLPSITHLIVGGFAHNMVTICPNLERLEVKSYYHHWSWDHWPWDQEENSAMLLLQEASRVPTITSLSFEEQQRKWDRQLVRDILQAIPNLRNLSMLGTIRDTEYGDDPIIWPDMEFLLYELKSASNLTYLYLPEAYKLGLGYNGGPGCGNVYFGAEGRQFGRQMARERMDATEEAGRIAFEVLPHLKNLSIGTTSPVDIIRDEEGNVAELKWKWTGRTRDYLYGIWPE